MLAQSRREDGGSGEEAAKIIKNLNNRIKGGLNQCKRQ
jgi:hypothetical protein